MDGERRFPFYLFVLLMVILDILYADASCTSSSDCGWSATCNNQSQCACPSGFALHSDGKNCRNVSCTYDDCLDCSPTTSTCLRCVSFMSSTNGKCLTKCEGSAELKGNNYICTESEDDEREVDIVVAVVAGVGAGMLLCVFIILGVCLYLRKTRKKINLQSQNYRNGQMEIGHVKQYPAFDNSAFETDSQVDYRPGKIDPLHYVNELDQLRPHTDTLMTLLSQVKAKTRAMSSSDPRVSTYKGVIHQLCRVLVLLHKKDPVVSIPSDALSLLQWAQQMLDDHREQQSSSGGTAEYPIAQISAVDEDFQQTMSPVYATPNENTFNQSFSHHFHNKLANPYSSVPVPMTATEESQRQRRSSRHSGYATIRRTPSIPNEQFLNALENGTHPHAQDIFPGTELEPVNVSTFSSQPQASGMIVREDFQNFLINNGRSSSDEHSTLDKKNINTTMTSFNPEDSEIKTNKRLSRQEPPPEIFNTSSESYGDIDFTGGYHSQSTPNQNNTNVNNQNGKHLPEINDDAVVLCNKNNSINSIPTATDNATPPVKRNIITNLNALKKSSPASTLESQGKMNNDSFKSKSNVGYFANGHFYESNPSPSVVEPEPEVYAPGSAFSEHSNIMSTFLGDLPQSRTPSQSDQSDDEESDSGGELDVFPFDPKEATNPVEV